MSMLIRDQAMSMGRDHSGRLTSVIAALAVVALLMASSVETFGSQRSSISNRSGTHWLPNRWANPTARTTLVTRAWQFVEHDFIPTIAEGKVFVLVDNGSDYGTNLYALDAATGATVWGPFQDKFGSFSFAGLAYDAGRVFVLNFDGFCEPSMRRQAR